MSGPTWAGGLLLLATLILFFYWQLILAEGAYLGRRMVVWLYDLYARRYDSIKQFKERDDALFLGEPLAQALLGVPTPLVLDVATGTGRLPLALFRQPTFNGRVVALDLSRRMLRRAVHKTAPYQSHTTLLWQGATRLPFPDGAFDAVTCLEALEFLPDARATLAEMVRVLRPGGLLLASNRTGSGARWMPGRTMSRRAFIGLLESFPLEKVQVNAWQIDYDIAWARKSGRSTTAAPSTLPALLRCPRCAQTPLSRRGESYLCDRCNRRYPVADDGVIEMGW